MSTFDPKYERFLKNHPRLLGALFYGGVLLSTTGFDTIGANHGTVG